MIPFISLPKEKDLPVRRLFRQRRQLLEDSGISEKSGIFHFGILRELSTSHTKLIFRLIVNHITKKHNAKKSFHSFIFIIYSIGQVINS